MKNAKEMLTPGFLRNMKKEGDCLKSINLETWVKENADRIFGFTVYKRKFTPYEKSEKFVDESLFEDERMTYCKIKEAIYLGGGDWLLGVQPIYDETGQDENNIDYYRLSEIRLCSYEYMQHDLKNDFDETDVD